jgi:chitodextrinase
MHCPANAAIRHYDCNSVSFLSGKSKGVFLGKVFTYGILLALAAFSPAAYSQMDPARTTDGLVVFYPFDEGAGQTVNDRSGYGSPMNLTLFGAVSWNNAGTGVMLNGGRVGTGGAATKLINALRNSNSSTFEAWVRPSNTNQGGPSRLIAIAKDPYERNYLLGQEGKNIQVRLRHTGKNVDKPHLITTNQPLNTKPTHIVHTYDGSVERLYINGVLQANTISRGGAYSNWYTNHLFSIGNEASNDRPYAGTIEMVAIYNRALILSEVTQNFGAGSNSSVVSDTSPPSMPGSLYAQSSGSTTGVALDWTDAQDDVGVSGYWIYRDGTRIGDSSQTNYVDVAPSPNTSYRYSVKAYDEAGNSSDSASITFITPASTVTRASTGLVALYPFNEGSGSVAADRSGSGSPMNLELFGAVSWSKTGNGVIMNGGRVASSGAANKVINALRASNSSSFEAWVQPSNVNQRGPTRFIAIAKDPYQRNYLLGQQADEIHVRLRHTGKSADKPHLITVNGPLGTQMTHVVHTYDGSTERLYVDGVLQSTQVARSGAYSNWYADHVLSIGNEATNDRPFAGHIKLVAIYDRALNGAEIRQNFAAGPASDNLAGSDIGESSGNGSTSGDVSPQPGPGSDLVLIRNSGSSAELAWTIPTERESGVPLPLADISHYEIVAVPTGGASSRVFVVSDPRVTKFTLPDLPAATYQLSISTFDTLGLKSNPSSPLTLQVQ